MDGTHPMDDGRRCAATSRQMERCKRAAIVGGAVCSSHGGAAPQVKQAAAERIAGFVDPALTELIRIVNHGESDAVKLAAVKDVLDRAGYKPREKTDLTVSGGLAIYLPDRKVIP